MTTTRRGFLRAVSGVAAASVLVGKVTAQSEFQHWNSQPDHVTLTYDESTLLQYAPRLELVQEAREKLQGLWGWTATSQEYDRDWHVYVALYTHQTGLSPMGSVLSDSHLGDTEFYYVASDSETGETQRVIYDAYHWVAGDRQASSIPMKGRHPVARVVSPWHFYTHQDPSADNSMAFDEIGDLTVKFGAMLSNGLAESLEPGTVVDPTTMTSRAHWWRSSVGEWSVDAALASAMYSLGWVGADNADAGVSF